MPRPRLSWIPVRLINGVIDQGSPTLEEWMVKARGFGLDLVEFYVGFLKERTIKEAKRVRGLLDDHGLSVCQVTCAPDFTHPDAGVRASQIGHMRENIDFAAEMGAMGCRITAGCRYPGVREEDGVDWAVEGLLKSGEYAKTKNIQLGFENHYKDKRWEHEDFIMHAEVYLKVFERIKDSWVGVNFDCSNQVMVSEDPMKILNRVISKVWHCHASDRHPGVYKHTVIGEGVTNYDAIFKALSDYGFSGIISLEDGQPGGDPGTLKSFSYLRRKIDQYWGKQA